MRVFKVFRLMILVAVPLTLAVVGGSAQEKNQPIKLSAADQAAAASAKVSTLHAMGLSTVNRKALWSRHSLANLAGAEIPAIASPGFYPGDLSNPGNGTTIQSAQSHGVYVNCLPGCWGNPAKFLNDLNHSRMIHLTDEFVGTSANHRYPNGNGGLLTGSLPHILYDADMVAFAHAAASVFGSGYGHIYHIYLPPGQDICFSATAPVQCYSPDNFDTFYFCAYHSSADFSDIGHVLYTVEPYQAAPGCNVQQPSPNGPVIDSTADVLSHELFETITDPDGTAWWNKFSLDLFGAENGDECQDFTFGYGSVSLNGTKYEIQPEYSNLLHGCAVSPESID